MNFASSGERRVRAFLSERGGALAVFVAALSGGFPLLAGIELGTPFSDGAVLQREMDVPVWGKAAPGETVSVTFAGATVSSVAAADGRWSVRLPKMAASKEGRLLSVKGSASDPIEIRDILVGEVWICSGQSNAECPIWGDHPRYRDGWGAMMLTSVNKPFVRLVKTPLVASVEPREGYKVEWLRMTPDLYGEVGRRRMPSAMGYYYALELANALDIPIGLVDSTWGGTNIDAWTPRSGYEGAEALKDVAALPVLDPKAFGVARTNGVYKGKTIYGRWIQQPTVLWNGLVAAFAPMACRGFIWYQGGHNIIETERYCDKLHALYNGWAREFANPDFKMYFVQIAPSDRTVIAPFWLAQAKFEREEPHAGMVVVNDVGNPHDRHPNDKRTVAKRLSLHALRRDYGWTSVHDDSPTLRDWRIENGRFVLSFDNAEGWYVYNPSGSVDVGFEICGADGVWKPAGIVNLRVIMDGNGKPRRRGHVEGRELIVEAKGVAAPVGLRYLHSAPMFGALYNEYCLPLGAFRIGK